MSDIMITNDLLYKSEMLVLSLLQNKELEFYEISQKLSQYSFEIKQGILFTILYQLEQAQLITHIKQDNDHFYRIEEAGLVRLDMLKRKYQILQENINNFMKVSEHE